MCPEPRVSKIKSKTMINHNLKKLDDLGHYCDVLDEIIELHQLQKGRISILERSFNICNEIDLYEKTIDKKVAITQDIIFDKMRFAFPRFPEITAGFEINAGSLVYYQPGKNYPSVLSDKFHSFDIYIDEEFFKNYNPELYETINNYSKNSICIEIAHLVTPNVRSIRQALLVAMSANEIFGMGDFKEFTMSNIEKIYSVYLDKDFSETTKIDYKLKNWDMFIQMVDFIKSNPIGCNIEILAKEFSISSRTVLNIFKKFSGISPSQFTMAYRICLARTHLLNERRFDDPVTRAAVEADFFHLGRFSHYYYSFFGEKPSDTVFRLQKEMRFIGNGKK